jgi:hypothetical protein
VRLHGEESKVEGIVTGDKNGRWRHGVGRSVKRNRGGGVELVGGIDSSRGIWEWGGVRWRVYEVLVPSFYRSRRQVEGWRESSMADDGGGVKGLQVFGCGMGNERAVTSEGGKRRGG